MREFLHTHATLAAFVFGWLSGLSTAGVAGYLSTQRAKRRATKPGNN